MRPNRGFTRIPVVAIRIEEEEFHGVTDESGYTEEITGVESGKRQIFDKEEFLSFSFGEQHNDAESDDREAKSDQPPDDKNFEQPFGVCENKTYKIVEPHIIADAIEEYGFHV